MLLGVFTRLGHPSTRVLKRDLFRADFTRSNLHLKMSVAGIDDGVSHCQLGNSQNGRQILFALHVLFFSTATPLPSHTFRVVFHFLDVPAIHTPVHNFPYQILRNGAGSCHCSSQGELESKAP